MLRHERMSVAMAPAAATHHSAQRGEWRDLNEAPRGQRTASAEATNDALRSQTTSVAGDTEFFSLYEEELGGTRPDRLYEVRPQGRVQRHTVEQIVESPQVVPSLDVPVPQTIPEQAIEVPKISSTPCPPRRRRVRFAEQMAEQLVEVPTIISYSSLRGIMEQNVDIPVPRGDRTLHSASSSSVLPVTANQGVFRTLPELKKKSPKLGSHSGSELLPESSPSTLSAHQMATDERTSMVDANGHAWVRLDTARGTCWKNLDTGHTQWRPPWEH